MYIYIYIQINGIARICKELANNGIGDDEIEEDDELPVQVQADFVYVIILSLAGNYSYALELFRRGSC